MVCASALIVGILITANWCLPDGGAPSSLDSFVFSLHSLETQHARKVRVLHFGDSHIASDTESSVVRSYLQNIFGDGGPGLVLPWGGPRLTSLNIAYGNTYGWQRIHPTYNSPEEDTGLSLNYLEAESPNQSAWIEATGSAFRVYFLAQPEGGEAEFLLDGVPLGQRKMSANAPRVEVANFQAPVPDAPHRFEIRTQDYGKVRILGVSVEKSAPGVIYSALGLVGARAEYLLKCRQESFIAQVSGEQPDLIILGYGTNETTGSYLDVNAYDAALGTIISRLHRAAPAALVVLLTPPDRADARPGQAQRVQRILQEVIDVQRAVAEREGAILIDLRAAMGGAGTAERWAALQPPLAQADMTHFTNEGYNLLGRYIVGGIMKLYDGGAGSVSSSSPGDGKEEPTTVNSCPHSIRR
jgi:lysophospholipase L1-like esterase